MIVYDLHISVSLCRCQQYRSIARARSVYGAMRKYHAILFNVNMFDVLGSPLHIHNYRTNDLCVLSLSVFAI